MTRRRRMPSAFASLMACIATAAPAHADETRRYPDRPDIPAWWQRSRAFYCPLANSGAGGSLMKYKTERTENFKGFRDLPNMLDDARALGTDVIYLVDYWEPGYEYKGEYEPKRTWGGAEALRLGIQEVHRRGGRVILYLEAFIISRKTELGRTYGPNWGMKDEHGNYYSYFDTGDRFYLMFPGEGSFWTPYLVDVARALAKDFKIDGVHLDSYGLQWNWRDHNPIRPHAKDPEAFNRGAVDLVKRTREAMREHVPDAVVILEGAEQTELLDVCDGAQIESLEVLNKKPWAKDRRYPIFTSSFSLEEMGRILDEGHNLALSPWWFDAHPGKRDRERLEAETDKRNRFDQLMALHRFHNVLAANNLLPDDPADFQSLHDGIIEHLNKHGWGGTFKYPPLERTAKRYVATYEKYRNALTRTPADAIGERVRRAEGRDPTSSPSADVPPDREGRER